MKSSVSAGDAMIYKYLYQTKENENREGTIRARTRDEVYALLRKQGIRPYRVIGDDPWNWRPWAIGAGYLALLAALGVTITLLVAEARRGTRHIALSEEEAKAFRLRAEDAVFRAPEAYRYNVWKGVNARLAERGLEPIPKPEGLAEEEDTLP